MSKILAIDTSSFVLGVAVIDGEQVAGEIITNSKKNHALRLMPAISKLMDELKIEAKQLDKIVVANGPGSYTGVRIGVTTAKTMAWSLGIPLVMVSSLEVSAQIGRYAPHSIIPLIDARRGQVYTGLYRSEGAEVIQTEADQLILLEDWLLQLREKSGSYLFVGQDVTIHQTAIKEVLGERAYFAPKSMALPRPSELALLGQWKEDVESVHAATPQYLQLAEAEVKWKAAQKEKQDND